MRVNRRENGDNGYRGARIKNQRLDDGEAKSLFGRTSQRDVLVARECLHVARVNRAILIAAPFKFTRALFVGNE